MLDTEREIFEQILEEFGECIHEYTQENIPVREQTGPVQNPKGYSLSHLLMSVMMIVLNLVIYLRL